MLKNKKFIITGASKGIGFEITKQLTEIGSTIVMSSSNIHNLEIAKEKLEKKDNVHLIEFDVSNIEESENFIKKSKDIMQGFDGIICNAGVTKDGLSLRMKMDDWDTVQNINLKSIFALNKFAFKHLMKNQWGRIINMSSVVAFTGNLGQANYCAAKGGMVSMSKALSLEYAQRKITVNCVAPGFIETDMTDKIDDERKKYILSKIPVGKIGHVTDIANTTIFLLSDAADYITGQTFHVNGGMYM